MEELDALEEGFDEGEDDDGYMEWLATGDG